MSLSITLDGFYSSAQNLGNTLVRLSSCVCFSDGRRYEISKSVTLSCATSFFHALGCSHVSNALLVGVRQLKSEDFIKTRSIISDLQISLNATALGIQAVCVVPENPILQRPLFQCENGPYLKIMRDFEAL